jgi:hypothetical protein
MHAGNVWRIREKRVNTRRNRVFYTLLKYSHNIPPSALSHHKRTRRVFLFLYNISRRFYIINNFTQGIDIEILLTCTQWRHAHAFTVAWIFKRAKEQKQYKILMLKLRRNCLKCWAFQHLGCQIFPERCKIVGFVVLLSFNNFNLKYCIVCLMPKIYLAVFIRTILIKTTF